MSADHGEQPSPDLTDAGGYAFWTREKIRFQDVDRFGHVNNVAFTVYAESGRIEFLERAAGVLPAATQWVIARLLVDFRAQAFYPGEVRVGTRTLNLGRSSLTLGQGLFSGERCIATARAVVVLIDSGRGASAALPPALRSALSALA